MINKLIKLGFFDNLPNIPDNVKLYMFKEAHILKYAELITELMATGLSNQQAIKLLDELKKRNYPIESMKIQDIITILKNSAMKGL